MSFRFQFISRFFGCQQQKLSNHIFYRFSTTYWLQFQTFLLNKSLFLHCCWTAQCVNISKSGSSESNRKMRLFGKIFQHHEQLVMPSCQSRAERQKGRLKADKSALETWSSAPLVVKQVFAFFSAPLPIMSEVAQISSKVQQLPVSGSLECLSYSRTLSVKRHLCCSFYASILMAPIDMF